MPARMLQQLALPSAKGARASFNLLLIILFAADLAPAFAATVVDPGTSHEFLDGEICGSPATFPVDPGIGQTVDALCTLPTDIEARAALTAVFGAPSEASIEISTPFDVSGPGNTLLEATITAEVSWLGVLSSFGSGGEATVEISLFLRDTTVPNVESKFIMHTNSVTTSISSPSDKDLRDQGSANKTFQTTVTRGHSYEIGFVITTIAENTVISTARALYFTDPGLGFNGCEVCGARWGVISIAVEPDLVELLTRIEEKIDVLDERLDTIEERQLEEIRLLHTPQGRRSTTVPACEGQGCEFPE